MRWVGVADQAEQWDFAALSAVVEEAFVEDCEQRVEDGAVCLEDLVHEGHGGGGQVPLCLPDVLVFLQRTHGQRTEQLLHRAGLTCARSAELQAHASEMRRAGMQRPVIKRALILRQADMKRLALGRPLHEQLLSIREMVKRGERRVMMSLREGMGHGLRCDSQMVGKGLEANPDA